MWEGCDMLKSSGDLHEEETQEGLFVGQDRTLKVSDKIIID
jgi:hypothetical protein